MVVKRLSLTSQPGAMGTVQTTPHTQTLVREYPTHKPMSVVRLLITIHSIDPSL